MRRQAGTVTLRHIVNAIGALIGLGVLAAIIYPFFMGGNYPTQRRGCLVNLKQLALVFESYRADHDDALPSANNWMDATQPFAPKPSVYVCYSVKNPREYGYAMNRFLSARNWQKLEAPAEMGLVHDSRNLARNANEYFPDFPVPSRHNDSSNVLFADGHVRSFSHPKT